MKLHQAASLVIKQGGGTAVSELVDVACHKPMGPLR